jgi:fatty-acid desaturase
MHRKIILFSLVFALHFGALSAFIWFFEWSLLVASLLLWQVFGIIGLSVAYHRQICHRAITTSRSVLFFHLLCGLFAGQGGPITWTRVHRAHHADSDGELDPHSPKHGGILHAHLSWLLSIEKRRQNPLMQKQPSDLLKDPMIVFFENFQPVLFFAMFVLLYVAGGWGWVTWFGFFRVCLTLHTAWSINSFMHLYGYRNFETRDDSKNLHWLALITAGEGYHNNHHRFPSSATTQVKPGEFDISYLYIRTLEKLGLAKARLPQLIESESSEHILESLT